MTAGNTTPGGAVGIPGLYAHVPFCAHKCEYCAFYSAPPKGQEMARYTRALIRELEFAASELRPETVYFGGGTPSLLPVNLWQEILSAMERLNLLGAGEFTIECNPATVSEDKARLWRDYGVNRVSLGVQSLDESLLDRLGRIHTRQMVYDTCDLLRRVGFDNLNVDLMFAIPGQTMEIWRKTLAEAIALGSEHLSCYEVIYEDDTPLFEQLKAGRFDVNEELACDMYEELIQQASSAGFHQYEVANFARHTGPAPAEIPDHACKHNIGYWRGLPFYGAGPSASSFVNGIRFKNWSNTRLYCELLEKNARPIESKDILPPLARAGEIAGFGLRMTAGWPFELFIERTGFDLRKEWSVEMERLISLGYAVRDDRGFRLTCRGLRYADWAAELFLRESKGETAKISP